MYAIYFWLVIILMEVFMLLTGLVLLLFTFPFDPMRKVIDWHSTIWAKLHYWLNPRWKMHYTGGEYVKKNKPYIIISNHQSMLDIVLMYQVSRIFKWVSKKEALWIPFAGQALWMHRDILIRRGNKGSIKHMVKKAQYFFDHNICVCVFPEGTRTLDGQIHRFKEGAFVMAKLTHTAILPVVMDGNFDVMPKKSYRIKARKNFHIKVLPEISVEEIDNTSVKDLAQKMYDLMLYEHKKMAPERYK